MSAGLREVPTEHEWLPSRCPSWCRGDHAAVIIECGDSVENWRDAQEHAGMAFDFLLNHVDNSSGGRRLRKGGGSYDVSARKQETTPQGAYSLLPVVRVEVQSDLGSHRASIDLLPSEARTLAARLLRIADAMELEP